MKRKKLMIFGGIAAIALVICLAAGSTLFNKDTPATQVANEEDHLELIYDNPDDQAKADNSNSNKDKKEKTKKSSKKDSDKKNQKNEKKQTASAKDSASQESVSEIQTEDSASDADSGQSNSSSDKPLEESGDSSQGIYVEDEPDSPSNTIPPSSDLEDPSKDDPETDNPSSGDDSSDDNQEPDTPQNPPSYADNSSGNQNYNNTHKYELPFVPAE